jgi:hypothetical protein
MKVRTFRKLAKRGHAVVMASICTASYALPLSTRAHAMLPQQSSAEAPASAAAVSRSVGTVKSISGATVTLRLDSGSDATIVAQDSTKILLVAPGQKDLKQATPIAVADLQPGDRILVRGKPADDGKSTTALSIIVMAKTDVVAKQAKDREQWQRHGLGGIVSSVDAAASTIVIGVTVAGEKKNIVVKISKDTVLRRYAANSVKFDEAVPAGLDAIKPGDQLRARGERTPDGTALAADEVVSGTFRNIAGTVTKTDPASGIIIVQDLATKKPVTVKITADSQLRRLSTPIAQRIAIRLKGESPSANSPHADAGSASRTSPTETSGRPNGAADPNVQGPGRPGGAGRPGDLQQLIATQPATSLAELQKGDAVMIVTTEGTDTSGVTAITLLAGVEPILQASPNGQSSLLSAWSLGAAPGGDAGTP